MAVLIYPILTRLNRRVFFNHDFKPNFKGLFVKCGMASSYDYISLNRPADEITDPVDRKKADNKKREQQMIEHLAERQRQAKRAGVTP